MKGLVVGGGSIGARHLGNLESLGVYPLALVEPIAERRAELCASGRITGFAELAQGLDWQPDFVVIATPSNLHLSQALQAIQLTTHLFVEKPLAHSTDGLDDLVRHIDQRNIISLVGCNMRFHPGPATVKRLIAAGAVGQIIAARIHAGSYLPQWRPWQDYRQSYSASPEYGGIILDGIHEIDLALWYLGAAQVLAAAWLPAQSIGLETDGLAEILLRHTSGVLSSVHLNFVQRDYCRTCQIIGTDGTIDWNFGEHRVRLYDAEGKIKETIPEPSGWEINQMYVDEMQHFLECVKTGSQTINPVSTAAETLRVALTARQIGKSGVR